MLFRSATTGVAAGGHGSSAAFVLHLLLKRAFAAGAGGGAAVLALKLTEDGVLAEQLDESRRLASLPMSLN